MTLSVRYQNALLRSKKRVKHEIVSRSPFFKRFPSHPLSMLVESRTHINFERRFVYSRIPKSANSTVIATLYEGEGDVSNRDFIESVKTRHKKPSQMTPNEIDAVYSSFFVFTITRNPFSRFLSCYLDKIARPSMYRTMVSQLHLGQEDADLSLDDFLDFLATSKGNLHLDAHWAPQSALLAFPIDRYDMIGAVETLPADIAKLAVALDLKGEMVTYIPHATNAPERMKSLTEAQVGKIRSLYARDFEAFGYSSNISDAVLPPQRSEQKA